jgi:hypothetical protein
VRARPWLVATLLPLGLLAACGDGGTPTAQPSNPSTAPATTGSPSRSASPTQSPAEAPSSAGSASAGNLTWSDVPGSTADETTVSGKWRLTLVGHGAEVELDGPRPQTLTAPKGWTFSHALIDGFYAVAVAQQKLAEQPDRATVIDLRAGTEQTIDGASTPPTTTGGSWVLAGGVLTHATRPAGDYCLAFVDLLADRSDQGPCAGKKHGFSNVVISPSATTALTFDTGHPSCRTPAEVSGTKFAPLPGIEECKGFDAASTETGQVWSEIPNEQQIEVAHFYADFGDGRVDLGAGTSGSLIWCGAAAYFTQDPQTQSDPARLIKVTPDGPEVVFESQGKGNAFLGSPRCGGRDLTVSAYAEAGDQQVVARLG